MLMLITLHKISSSRSLLPIDLHLLLDLRNLLVNLLETPILEKCGIQERTQIVAVVIGRVIIAMQRGGKSRHLMSVDGIVVVKSCYNFISIEHAHSSGKATHA